MSAIVTELCAEVDALRKQNKALVEALKATGLDWNHVMDEFEARVDPLDDEDIIWLEGHRYRHEQAQRALAKVTP